MALSREEVMQDYKTTPHRGRERGAACPTVTSPGKFEGEPIYVVSMWDASLDGSADDEISDPDTGGETSIYVVIVGDADLKEYPELRGIYAVTLWETEQGFVNHKDFPSKKAYEAAVDAAERELESPSSEDDDEDDGDLGGVYEDKAEAITRIWALWKKYIGSGNSTDAVDGLDRMYEVIQREKRDAIKRGVSPGLVTELRRELSEVGGYRKLFKDRIKDDGDLGDAGCSGSVICRS